MAKKIPLTQDEIVRIEKMAGQGLNVSQMAAILGMSKKTFERRMHDTKGAADALEKGRAEAAEKITGTAYRMALSGKFPAMTMFWLKCRERWRDVNVHEVSGQDGKPIEVKSAVTLTDEQLEAEIAKRLPKDAQPK